MSQKVTELTELQKTVLYLREKQKLTFSQISKAVGRKCDGNICYVYHRARRIRETLERKQNAIHR